MSISNLFRDYNLFGFGRSNNLINDGDGYFYPVGDTSNILSLTNYSEIESAYYQCSTLQTVIVNKAQASVNGKVKILNDKGVEISNSFTKSVLDRMKRPNLSQTYAMFRAESKILTSLYGWHIVWYIPNMIGGFVNIWNLNPVLLKIEWNRGKFLKQTEISQIIKKITYNYCGIDINVPVNEVYFVKDTVNTKTDLYTDEPPFLPTSRILGMQMSISNNIAALDARNAMITTRGAQGIISNTSKDAAGYIPMLAGEKENIQKQFTEGYGINRHQKKFVIVKNEVKFIPINLPTKELMLFEEHDSTKMDIVDVYGYKMDLLATIKGTTYANQKEAMKGLYQDTIIPEEILEMPQIFAGFKLEEKGLIATTDYSDLVALKADEVNNEQLKTSRIANINTINAMAVDYNTKLNIAVDVLEIDLTEAKQIIYNGNTITIPQG